MQRLKVKTDSVKLTELHTECVGVNCGRPPLVDFGVVEVEVRTPPLCLSMLFYGP